MSTGGKPASTSTRMLQRYAPFLAILVLQAVLLWLTPGSHTTTVQAPATQSTGEVNGAATLDQQPGAVSAGGGGSTVAAGGSTAGGSTAGAASSSSGGTAARAATATGGATKAATTGGATSGAATAAQALDPLGRPTTGDKSKCAGGGLLQETITYTSPPCIPKFVGDNGGPTYDGVTKDSFTVLLVLPTYPQAVDVALQGAGLSASPEEYQKIVDIYQQFFNKHYEFYGRQMKVQTFYDTCGNASGDNTCFRTEAKQLQAKYHPFVVTWYVPAIGNSALFDQLSQLKILNVGAGAFSDAWFKNHAPYAWSQSPQGDRIADMVGDYYCKRMWGKNATLAGDPTMRLKKRKLGIVTSEDPANLAVAQRLKAQVTGGDCGSEADGTTLYTLSADPAQAANQQSTLITRMKNDGITTVTGIPSGANPQEMDKQNFSPENLLSGANDADDDLVGRFAAAAGSPNQMQHTFGVGWFPKASPPSNHESYKAAQDVDPSYTPPYISEGLFDELQTISLLSQWAGPTLTPANVEKGAHSSVKINGWVNTTPWPGWKCCTEYGVGHWVGMGANSYSFLSDAREVHWDSAAVSPSDGQPGSWVCSDPNCHRYEIGNWPKGEPLTAS